jgi:histidinol-phosphate aminotransferase
VIAPRVRDDLALMEGYHSPQVDVAVRLNTNESPDPPPQAFVDALAAGWRGSPGTATPTGRPPGCARRSAACTGSTAEQVFAANGSNEVLQTLCLAYGGAGRTALVFEPTYALHAHIARLTGTQVVEGERADDFTLDLDEVAG